MTRRYQSPFPVPGWLVVGVLAALPGLSCLTSSSNGTLAATAIDVQVVDQLGAALPAAVVQLSWMAPGSMSWEYGPWVDCDAQGMAHLESPAWSRHSRCQLHVDVTCTGYLPTSKDWGDCLAGESYAWNCQMSPTSLEFGGWLFPPATPLPVALPSR